MRTAELIWHLVVALIPLGGLLALLISIQYVIDRRARWEDEHLGEGDDHGRR